MAGAALGISHRSLSLIGLLVIFAAPLLASGSDDGQPARGALDGMSFVGKLGPADKDAGSDDVLYFGEGQFWSKNCVPCGFQPGAYYVREVPGGFEFQGVLESEERGRFRYSGIVRDGRVRADINWRKERWYWTIDKEFRFEGDLSPAAEMGTAEQASRVASAANPEPEDCPL